MSRFRAEFVKRLALLAVILTLAACDSYTDESGKTEYFVGNDQLGAALADGKFSIWKKADEQLRKPLCEAVQNDGIKLTESFDVTLEMDLDLSSFRNSSTVSIHLMYITPITRAFNDADPVSAPELTRLTKEAEKVCHIVEQEAAKLGLTNTHISIGQGDYIGGVRIFYSGECSNLSAYEVSAGSGKNRERVDKSMCPSIKVTG